MTINNNTIDVLVNSIQNTSNIVSGITASKTSNTTSIQNIPTVNTKSTSPSINSDSTSIELSNNMKQANNSLLTLSAGIDLNQMPNVTNNKSFTYGLNNLSTSSTQTADPEPNKSDSNTSTKNLTNIHSKVNSDKKVTAKGSTGKRNGMYDYYFTASDCNVYLVNPILNIKLHIDKLIGVAWNQGVSSSPVYTLGNSNPTFFTKGNSLVQGSLELAFKSTEYMKMAFNYLLGLDTIDKLEKELSEKAYFSTTEEAYMFVTLQGISRRQVETPSLSNVNIPLNIEIEFDNSNELSESSSSSSISITDVKFIAAGMAVHSGSEQALTYRYSFMGKNVE